MKSYQFIGIDVSKDKLDSAIQLEKQTLTSQFENTLAGYKACYQWITQYSDCPFVCLEATGCYSDGIAEYLVKQKIRVSVVNPFQIKRYAQSRLTRNKTDKLDACLIASYAKTMQPRQFVPKSKEQKHIKELCQFIDLLVEEKQRLNHQRESIKTTAVKRYIDADINTLTRRIKRMEEELAKLIEQQPRQVKMKQRLLSVVGIGEKTAHRLIAYLPDLSTFQKAKQLAAFIGLTPRQCQSGRYRGKTKLSKYGDPRLRKLLYMPALVAKNKNPHLQPFCLRLEKTGLKPKQIICAVMRKLVHLIFGMLKNQTDFNPDLV